MARSTGYERCPGVCVCGGGVPERMLCAISVKEKGNSLIWCLKIIKIKDVSYSLLLFQNYIKSWYLLSGKSRKIDFIAE